MATKKKIKALFCGGYILEDGTLVTDEDIPLPDDSDEGASCRRTPERERETAQKEIMPPSAES